MMLLMFIKLIIFLLTVYLGYIAISEIYRSFKEPKTDKKLSKTLDEKKDKLEDMEAKNRTLTEEITVTEKLSEATKEVTSKQNKVNNLNEEI